MPKKKVRFNTVTSLSKKDLSAKKLQFIHWTQEVVDRFRHKLTQFGRPYKGFYVIEGDPELYWSENDPNKLPSEQREFTIIPDARVEEVLNDLYHSAEHGLRGIDGMWRKISQSFIGISYQNVEDFLKRQSSYQQTLRPKKKPIVNPLTASEPNERWQVDLIDFRLNKAQANRGHSYIMVVKDIFSKKIYLEALKSKSAGNIPDGSEEGIELKPPPEGTEKEPDLNMDTLAALKQVIARARALPKIIQTDRGNEFWGGFHTYITAPVRKPTDKDEDGPFGLGIRHIFSKGYTPTSQGQVERSNQDIKNILRKHYLLNNTKNWIDILPDIEANINATPHSSNFYHTPAELASTHNGNLIDKVAANMKARAKAVRERRGLGEVSKLKKKFEVGGKVRISKKALKAAGVENDKTTKTNLPGYWSEEIFSIVRVNSGGSNVAVYVVCIRCEFIQLPKCLCGLSHLL